MIFIKWIPEKIWHENLTDSPPRLSDVATVPWKIQKRHFNSIIHTYFWLFMLSHKKTICNPRAHPTWKCHHTNLRIAKLFHPTKSLLRPFRHCRLWKEPVVSCRQWLWKEPVAMCGNWNVSQAMSQQVFRVTTFCINTCFQSFSTLISRMYTTLWWNSAPCHYKPLPQASTRPYQYMRSSCSVPLTQ